MPPDPRLFHGLQALGGHFKNRPIKTGGTSSLYPVMVCEMRRKNRKTDMSDLFDVSGLGKLSIASNNDGTSKNATLLVVFGGIPVNRIEFDGIKRKKPVHIPSGDYMWNFMNDLKDRFTYSLQPVARSVVMPLITR